MNSQRTEDTNHRHAVPAFAPQSVSSAERADLLAARLADGLARAWHRGDRLRAEDLLAATVFLVDHPAAGWIVVFEEICQRRVLGPPPTLDEFLDRFPRWEVEIRRTFADIPIGPRFPACGESVAGCRLVTELGRGAAGRVFLAVQDDLAGRPVVLKMTPCAGFEHLSLARLLHSHIVPLYFVQDLPERNVRVLAMPYLGGASLEQVLEELACLPIRRRRGRHVLEAMDRIQARLPVRLPVTGPARTLWKRSSYSESISWLGACLAEALHYAHERGLVHLDLKPANVLLAGDGQPLLLDFHLARAPVPAGGGSDERFGGTPGFMAPEHRLAFDAVRAERPIPQTVDGRSDLYALGMVLYVALGGEPPPEGERARPLQLWNPGIGRGLSDILGKCLEIDPARRYTAAADLAADLHRYLANQPLCGVRNRSLVERWHKWRRRRPQALVAGLMTRSVFVALLALVVVGGFLFTGRYREARAALDEGKVCLKQGRSEEAERALTRGLERVEGLPGTDSLIRELYEERRRARRELFARRLHEEADRLRFLSDPETLSAEAARRLADRCERIWSQRDTVLSDPDSGDVAEQVRTDLLELVVQLSRWRVRAAPSADKAAARMQAVAVLAEAERLAGSGPALARERADHLAALGDAAGTRAALSRAATEPRSEWEQYALGRALLAANELEAAAAALARAVSSRPGAFWPNFYQGVCAHRRGRYAEAVEAFQVCVALAPEAAACYCNRGLALAALGRDADARRDFDRSLELDADLAAARLARAALALKQGRSNDAEKDLQRALTDGADPAAVFFNFALVYFARQDNTAARAALRTCLEHRPDHPAARDFLRRLGPR